MCRISDKSERFSLNYSNLFSGPLFSGHELFAETKPNKLCSVGKLKWRQCRGILPSLLIPRYCSDTGIPRITSVI